MPPNRYLCYNVPMNNILISGASRGIGREIALSAISSGRYNRIILSCHHERDRLEELVQDMPDDTTTECFVTSGDLGDISYVQSILQDYGNVDIIINNAAISTVGLLIDLTPDEWSRIISTNLTSIYNVCHTFLPGMISSRKGHIINISSVWGEVGASCEVAYSATKGAINSFTRALAKEVAPSGIQVNAIAPGIVDTEMNSHLSEEELEDICQSIPIGRMASPGEVADAVMRLIDMPAYVTGEIIRMDGGWI